MIDDSALEARLFLVSTPLHLLVTLAIVGYERLSHCHLVFIDQVEGKPNPYFDIIKHWTDSPFESVEVLYRAPRSFLAKRKSRQNTFRQLSRIIDAVLPSHIYVGNDRRIEFQWCMHCMQQKSSAAVGYYLDEGTFTYVGRSASDSISDRYIDNLAKKISYGLWWKHPPTVGASSWVSIAYVSFPELVHPKLATKELKKLSLDYWQTPLLLKFCQKLIHNLAGNVDLHDPEVIFTLPHESLMADNEIYKTNIQRRVAGYLSEGKLVGVKYHPRDAAKDALDLVSPGQVELLPSAIPFEAMLPMLQPKATVIGDFSTALITAKLLRPDLQVCALAHKDQRTQSNNNDAFLSLYKNLNIQLID